MFAIIYLAELDHGPFVQYFCYALYLLAVVIAAIKVGAVADTDDVERILAQAVIDCLHASRLTTKEAAKLMGVHHSLLERQLRAERNADGCKYHLSLSRLLRLGVSPQGVIFWAHLGPRLAYLVTQQRMEEMSELFRTRV